MRHAAQQQQINTHTHTHRHILGLVFSVLPFALHTHTHTHTEKRTQPPGRTFFDANCAAAANRDRSPFGGFYNFVYMTFFKAKKQNPACNKSISITNINLHTHPHTHAHTNSHSLLQKKSKTSAYFVPFFGIFSHLNAMTRSKHKKHTK